MVALFVVVVVVLVVLVAVVVVARVWACLVCLSTCVLRVMCWVLCAVSLRRVVSCCVVSWRRLAVVVAVIAHAFVVAVVMRVSKIEPCMFQYKLLRGNTANGSLKQLLLM